MEAIKINELETSNELNEVTVKYITRKKPSTMQKIISSVDCYEVFKRVFNPDTINYNEEFVLLLLNRSNGLIGWVRLSAGGMAGTVVDPRVVFAIALQTGTSKIIMAHNHPSARLTPSQADVNMTAKIKAAGEILEIELMDHLIISDESFYSFADEGSL